MSELRMTRGDEEHEGLANDLPEKRSGKGKGMTENKNHDSLFYLKGLFPFACEESKLGSLVQLLGCFKNNRLLWISKCNMVLETGCMVPDLVPTTA